MTPDQRARELFEATYGYAPLHVESAPGRVNLIGEHTDYNGGFVLPMALPQRTAAALAINQSRQVRSVSEQLPRAVASALDAPSGLRITFQDYLRAACLALAEKGQAVPGVDIAISSDVPIGSGLSSSAALVVATLRALRSALGLGYTDLGLAKIAHRAEHSFVGVPVGVMDPMACSLAVPNSALLLNTRSLEFENVAFPPELELAVIDSGQRHEHASGEYRARRAECEEAAAALGVSLLCELGEDAMERVDVAALSPKLRARVLHVLSENGRVAAAVDALRRADGERLGRLLAASHASLRDDFQVSTPEIDALVETATAVVGCLGARITGGGFGGSIVLLTRKGKAADVAREALEKSALRLAHLEPRVVVPLSSAESQA